jgi:sec-independent protein translocase protein TatC
MMQKPLLEHLIELRKRLIYCLAAFLVVFFGAYHFSPNIFSFLVQPLADLLQGEEGRRLIYTGLTEAFLSYLSVAFFTALFITLPLILWQVWRFISPGLYRQEKYIFASFFIATPLLFLL